MKDYIFEFEQKRMLDYKLSLKDVVLLKYLLQFFDSGNAVCKMKDGKHFFLITYNKIMEDLPILDINRRQLGRLILELENKKIIERFVYRRLYLYVWINKEKLFNDDEDSQKCLSSEERIDINDLPDSQKCPTIIKYYKSRVKILYKDNARVEELGCDVFLAKLKRSMRFRMGRFPYEISVNKSKVEVFNKNMIVLYMPCTNVFNFMKNQPLEVAVNKIFRQIYM